MRNYQERLARCSIIPYTERICGAHVEMNDEHFDAPWNTGAHPLDHLDAGYCLDAVNCMASATGYNTYFRW